MYAGTNKGGYTVPTQHEERIMSILLTIVKVTISAIENHDAQEVDILVDRLNKLVNRLKGTR